MPIYVRLLGVSFEVSVLPYGGGYVVPLNVGKQQWMGAGKTAADALHSLQAQLDRYGEEAEEGLLMGLAAAG